MQCFAKAAYWASLFTAVDRQRKPPSRKTAHVRDQSPGPARLPRCFADPVCYAIAGAPLSTPAVALIGAPRGEWFDVLYLVSTMATYGGLLPFGSPRVEAVSNVVRAGGLAGRHFGWSRSPEPLILSRSRIYALCLGAQSAHAPCGPLLRVCEFPRRKSPALTNTRNHIVKERLCYRLSAMLSPWYCAICTSKPRGLDGADSYAAA
jgi:hypothetical protein